ncbi:MAG: DUF2800 domain-containing protein [Muribaculaceae bacterium]|nr:DUF2800 domain-containing protein [Muribaculaceae bacterium]
MEGMAEMEEKTHALLGASNSHRWLECTPSARAEQLYPDLGSDFAKEGSLAHAIAAKKLKERLGQPVYAEIAEIKELSEFMSGEMEEYTTEYADFVMERYMEAVRNTPEGKVRPHLFVEKRLDYSEWVKDGFGTGDAVILSYDMLEVIDFKYGKGVKVDANNNPQMKLYALGTAEEFSYCYDFDQVRMTIYQPRMGNISSWETYGGDLLEWAERHVKPLATLAWFGEGSRKSGDWCRFCKAKGNCPRFTADCMVEYFMNPNAEALDPKTISRIFGMMSSIKDWVKAIEDKSLADALNGVEIPGYKLVEGKSNRKITDQRGLLIKLTMSGYDSEALMMSRKLKTLTELEKLIGKKKFGKLSQGFIEKPAGKPTLVPVGDKREILNNNDFKDLNYD